MQPSPESAATRARSLKFKSNLGHEFRTLVNLVESLQSSLEHRIPTLELYEEFQNTLSDINVRFAVLQLQYTKCRTLFSDTSLFSPTSETLNDKNLADLKDHIKDVKELLELFHESIPSENTPPPTSENSFETTVQSPTAKSENTFLELPPITYIEISSESTDESGPNSLYDTVSGYSRAYSSSDSNTSYIMAQDTALFTAVPLFDTDNPSYTIKDFINTIETIGTMGAWTEAKKIVVGKLRLTGKAKELISRNPHCNTFNTWDDFKTVLLDAFHIPRKKSDIEKELVSIKQKKNERVGQYALRLEALTAKIKPAHGANAEVNLAFDNHFNSRKLLYFVNGLLPGYRSYVRMKAPQDYDTAKANAKEAEQLKFEKEDEELETTSALIDKVDLLELELNNLKIKNEPVTVAATSAQAILESIPAQPVSASPVAPPTAMTPPNQEQVTHRDLYALATQLHTTMAQHLSRLPTDRSFRNQNSFSNNNRNFQHRNRNFQNFRGNARGRNNTFQRQSGNFGNVFGNNQFQTNNQFPANNLFPGNNQAQANFPNSNTAPRFSGACYYCNNVGHKVVDCQTLMREALRRQNVRSQNNAVPNNSFPQLMAPNTSSQNDVPFRNNPFRSRRSSRSPSPGTFQHQAQAQANFSDTPLN